MTLGDRIDRLVRLDSFGEVFAELTTADPVNGDALETALRTSLRETSEALKRDTNPDRLRYALFRQAVELKAQSASFLNYEREMAQREAALWRFAVDRMEDFFQRVFDALDIFFEARTEAALTELAADARWYSGLRDTAKQSGLLVNKSLAWLSRGAAYARTRLDRSDDARTAVVKAALELAGNVFRSGENLVDTRDVVQRVLDTHVGASSVTTYVSDTVATAAARYKAAWVDEIKAQTPDLRSLNAFASIAGSGFTPSSRLEIGAAEGVLAVGLSSALAGTFSLAAGWHVLAYAMVHVFYPVAFVVAMATVSLAVLDQDRSLGRRQRQVREAVSQYHRQLLLTLDAERFEELGGRSLRQWLGDHTKALVVGTVQEWQRAIGGTLTGEHYRRLGAACEAHLQLIAECLDLLGAREVTGGDASQS